MTYFILYIVGLFITWFGVAKYFVCKKWHKEDMCRWVDQNNNYVSDLGPAWYGFLWPFLMVMGIFYFIWLFIVKIFKSIDSMMWNAAKSVNIEVKKKS